MYVHNRVVLSQLSGRGRGDIGSYNADHYSVLITLLEEKPMKDGDEWLSTLMRKDRMLGIVQQIGTKAHTCHTADMYGMLCSNAHYGCEGRLLCGRL